MNGLDDLVQVEIDINSPVADLTSFDNILIFGAPPKNPAVQNIPAVGTYNTLAEVTDMGYDATGDDADPVGEAARIKFSNSNSAIVVAVQQPVSVLASDFATTVINANNAATTAVPIGTYDASGTNYPWLQYTYSRKLCDSAEVAITKDGTAVFGKDLLVTENANAFLQVCFTGNPDDEDKMNLATTAYAGVYVATFTFKKGDVTTTAVSTLSYNTDGTWNVGKTTVVSTPLEPIIDTLTRALDYPGWYVACEAGLAPTDFEECAELIEAQEKMFAFNFITKTNPVRDIYFRSFGVCGLGTDRENALNPPIDENFKHVAFAAQALKYHAGSETWANKTVSAVDASDFSGTMKTALTNSHSNWIQEVGGKNITRNGQTNAGEWIDTIRFRDWLKNDMQIRVANLLIVNPKVPYTDPGISLVENQMIASLKSGRDYGGIAPDQFADDDTVIPGFTTSVPRAMNLTATQRASRTLQDCSFTAILAGAIHLVKIHGSLVY
jgi:hypothetical protein